MRSQLPKRLPCALALIAALLAARPAHATLVTWDLVDVVIGQFTFTGSYTANSATGLVVSTDIYDQYLSNPPVSLVSSDPNVEFTTPFNLNFEFSVTNTSDDYALHVILAGGETFVQNVPTETFSVITSESTATCCEYITSGSLANTAFLPPPAVPEPATLPLFAAAAAALVWLRNRSAGYRARG